MKVETKQSPAAFAPVQVTFTFETQEELNAAFAIGNWNSQVADLISTNELHTGRKPVTYSAAQRVAREFYTQLVKYWKP